MFFLKPFHFMNSAHFVKTFYLAIFFSFDIVAFLLARLVCFALFSFRQRNKNRGTEKQPFGTRYTSTNKKPEKEIEAKKKIQATG